VKIECINQYFVFKSRGDIGYSYSNVLQSHYTSALFIDFRYMSGAKFAF